jgi:PKD repeat protein
MDNPTPQNLPPKNPVPKKSGSPQMILTIIIGFSLLLVFLFYAMLLWGAMSGNVSNPLFATLGVQAGELQELLLTFTNLFFGGISLLSLIIALVLIFKGSIISQDPEKKKRTFFKAGGYFFLLLVFSGIWVFLYWFINNLDSGPKEIKPTQSFIETIPRSTIGLDAPVQIEFQLAESLYEKIPAGNILQVTWDFDGDKRVDATAPKATHRFVSKGRNQGRFPVTAQVAYLQEGTEKTFTTVREVIITNEAVQGKISMTPASGEAPLEVTLSALDSRDPDGEVILYEWDLDNDGEFEIRQDKHEPIKKNFEIAGDYPVKLRVTGTNHDTSIVEKILKVSSPAGNLRAEISVESSLSGIVPFSVKLDASQSFVKEGKIVRYEWFVSGDKDPVLGRKFHRIIRDPGIYEITLTVQNDLGEKHQVKKVINAKPQKRGSDVKIKTTPASNGRILRGRVPFEVTFDASASQITNPIEWHWDFEGDGVIDSFTQAVKYTFREPGTYDVKLTILDDNEEKHESIKNIIVDPAGLQVKVKASPQAGSVPLEVVFDASASSTDKGQIIDYIWQLPNGKEVHYGAILKYRFDQIGVFPIRVTALTSEGKKETAQTLISVRMPTTKAKFTYFPKNPKSGSAISFNPQLTQGLVQAYTWDLGDGTVVRKNTPETIKHVYRDPGVYTVKLKTIDKDNLIFTREEEVIVE